MKRWLLCLLPGLLVACTGTEEDDQRLRLAVLTDGGSTLRVVTPAGDAGGEPEVGATVPVSGGVTLDSLPSGRRLALTRTAGIESLNADLADARPFMPPPFAATCLTQTTASAGRDRLLTLSECPGGPQELALYREDGTLVWTARLPTFLPPTPGLDAPPVRVAVSGEIAVVARPRGDNAHEVFRVAQATPGAPVAEAGLPQDTEVIRDLAPYGTDIVAATDRGLRLLTPSGVPQETVLAAFGSDRYNRVWSGSAGSGVFLAAWRGGVGSTQPLLLWDGSPEQAATVATLTDLRDVTLVPDGTLSALTATTLTRYDTLLGLAQGSWRPRVLLGGLNDARALTWLVPPDSVSR